VEDDPVLREPAIRRREVFAANYPAREFSPAAEWHISALREAGFTEAAIIWRRGNGAVLAAVL
jgi:hypothetical protein